MSDVFAKITIYFFFCLTLDHYLFNSTNIRCSTIALAIFRLDSLMFWEASKRMRKQAKKKERLALKLRSNLNI